MKSARAWWIVFAAGTIAVLLAMVGVSLLVLRLERAERTARDEATRQESLRLALWRMDSWLAPHLAREAARPYFEYLPYYPQERAYTRILYEIEAGEVLTPSPLLTFSSPYVALHVQIGADGAISSPQVPTGNLRDLAEATLVTGDVLRHRETTLASIAPALRGASLRDRMIEADLELAQARPARMAPKLSDLLTGQEQQSLQEARSQREQTRRADQYKATQQVAAPSSGFARASAPTDDKAEPPAVTVGAFVGLWLQNGSSPPQRRLVYLRPVQVGAESLVQGFLVDWPAMRTALLEQVTDLLAEADLEPIDLDQRAGRADVLAALPAALVAAPRLATAPSSITPARATLAIAWMVVLVAIMAAALGLRMILAYGERRSRFASAVTHELRTPLTTFQMYSEMLADGMIQDEDRRQSYLETLRRESARLAMLVENVLAYARLEKGGGTRSRRGMAVDDLLGQLLPRLESRAAAAGAILRTRIETPPDTTVRVDAEAVGQILFNLVDNACKYGCRGERREIDLVASADGQSVAIQVADHGPGIVGRHADRIFKAFERGDHRGDGDGPGLGLGLALSRGLARDLGGELELLRATDGEGARFELRLPRRE